eukprot:CAMPEP_0172946386 /NCGR_PEP_ID=MMETSP1075-20121228/227037_1 /TAXON_ID=2916 /ORGANISM="Ceratium fusus, Strain PA161109" /LENGTH=60 /DNA_ID=CAMNT_0013807843 /DNA_START=1642 /DNA_END=1824 /DNA_ORIENTATION=+
MRRYVCRSFNAFGLQPSSILCTGATSRSPKARASSNWSRSLIWEISDDIAFLQGGLRRKA